MFRQVLVLLGEVAQMETAIQLTEAVKAAEDMAEVEAEVCKLPEARALLVLLSSEIQGRVHK